MATLPIEEIVKMLKKLLAGQEVIAVTPEEIEAKTELLKDIAYAKKKGWQIAIPNI